MSTPSILIQLYEEQVKFLQGQIKVLKEHAAAHPTEGGATKKSTDGKKKKRALSAYQLFMKERLSDHKSTGDPKAVLTQVSKEWNGLAPADKERYSSLAKKFNDEKTNASSEMKPLPEVAKNSTVSANVKPSSESAPQEKKDKKRKAETAVEDVAAATTQTAKLVVPPTPAPALPTSPATEDVKTDKKKKKKHHKDGEKKVGIYN